MMAQNRHMAACVAIQPPVCRSKGADGQGRQRFRSSQYDLIATKHSRIDLVCCVGSASTVFID